MNTSDLILIVLSFFVMITIMFFSFLRLLKAEKRLRSKSTGDKRKGIAMMKNIAAESKAEMISGIGLGIFKHWL